MIELLAPAKDKLCAKVAIDYGADAIYIGASDFGARKNVANSIEDIKEIIEYAHKFKVKVYIAMNTILTDDEIKKAKEILKKLKEIKVDAIIIQDMGLVEYIKSLNIPIHASTQCDNRSAEKVNFLEKSGFSRVILARELSIEQIKQIKKQTDVELEAFIHGALCVSYSGQCYLSYAIGGRSANKGECAQPCRKKYSLVDEDGNFIAKGKYLMCLKDFNASGHIKELADAGITSFKIEGRLKDINYVKNTVAYYRQVIDNLGFEKKSSGKITYDFVPSLEKSFNRGFTDYFLDGKRKEIYNFESPKAKGEYLGKVLKISKDYFDINANVNPQDGLCFFDGEEVSGCLVNKIEKNKIFPNKMNGIKTGTKIFRNFDAEFEKTLKISKTNRKILAKITFDLREIIAIDEDNFSAKIDYQFEDFAQNEEKMISNIITQLKKTGDSDFSIENVEIKCDKLPFLPISKLNELRRELLEKLMTERLSKYQVESKAKNESEPTEFPQKELDYRGNVLNKEAKIFYENHGCIIKEPAFESGLSKAGKTVMTCKHCLKYTFKKCKDKNNLFLIDEKGKKYKLIFDCKNCEMKIIF